MFLAAALPGLAAAVMAVAPPAEPTFDRPASPDRITRVGSGLMVGGGLLMTTGAGVLVPIGLSRALRTSPPQPADYTDVPTYQRDLIAYQRSMHRAMMLSAAGAVTGVVGALVFTAGATTFAVGRRRSRRRADRVAFAVDLVQPGASLTVRF